MGNSTGTLPVLPIEQRHWALMYRSEDGRTGCKAYPINFDEVYNLKGRLLTLVDATFTDPEQRKAHKDLVWHTLREWMKGIVETGEHPDFAAASFKIAEAESAINQ